NSAATELPANNDVSPIPSPSDSFAACRPVRSAQRSMMSTPPDASSTPKSASAWRGRKRPLVSAALAVLVLYFVVAYLVLPLGWRRYEKKHPALDDVPRISHTATGIPGDPVNVGLIATENDIHLALLAAKWFPADPITLRSSIRIAGSTVFHRSYED